MPQFDKATWGGVQHFTPGEFSCRCCGKEAVQPELVRMIDTARDLAGIRFKVTSGYRCPTHNANVGSRPTSSHVKGLAADIAAVGSRNRYIILSALIQAGFTRLGIGKDFIHVDCDTDKDQTVAWLY